MANLFSNISLNLQLLGIAIASNKSEDQKQFFKDHLDKGDREKLFELAEKDEIAPHLVETLESLSIEYNPEWKKEYLTNEKRINNLMNELEQVASSLLKENIQIVGLKNAGITKGLYFNHACSPMGDIDLLVRSKDFHKAHDIITQELNYIFKFRSELEEENLKDAFKGGGTEYYKDVGGYRVWLELQWRPVAGRWIQPHNEPNGDELMNRSIPIENSNVRILNPEDNLLQVCLHTAKHSYCRAPGFRLHTDVDRIVRSLDIPWGQFVTRVKKMRLKTASYYSLLIPATLLGSPIPNWVIQEFRPNGIRRFVIESLLRKAQLTDQTKKKFSKLGYIIFNICLYDSFREIFTAVFPREEVMKKKYGYKDKSSLVLLHFKRLSNLIFKRTEL